MTTGTAMTATAARPLGRRASTAVAATVALVVVTAAWGSTFFMLKDVVARVPPADFLSLRFLVAAAVTALFAVASLRRLTANQLRRGMLLGIAYGGAQLLQTWGIQSTAASVSGFLTGLYVVLTPVLGLILLGIRAPRLVWLATAVSTVGLAVLSLQGLSLSAGALLTIAGAVLYALHIVGLGVWSTGTNSLGLTVVQLGVVALVCTAAALPGGVSTPQRPGDWLVLVFMALVAGAVALVVQTWSQAHLSAARAAIIMSTEPVFAAGFAVLAGGEAVTTRLVVGGVLVLTAMLLTPHDRHDPLRDRSALRCWLVRPTVPAGQESRAARPVARG